MSGADAASLTRRWLSECVLALDLCPFAGPVLRDGSLRLAVTAASGAEEQRQAFLAELDRLQSVTEKEISTTLLVYTGGPADFGDFLGLVGDAQSLLEAAGLLGEVQLAHFHPQYLFHGEPVASLSHYTNRSPYPTLHLLREAMVTRALAGFPDPEGIPHRNIRRLEQLGRERVEALWAGLSD